ncbi:MAP7 domain-containing protein 3 isoform X2 [Cavia porcellus]|uniref:MAP7 domain-containing protein 3 isoform X2 n=1 Tax=Cavia porcellus TaxID=10141 RepID=UPI002FE1FF4A
MADRAVARGSGTTSLRGLRERMVAEARAIAEERRSQIGVNSLVIYSPNMRSSVKPVIDGSVLKNDIKQKLAKERREEKQRQDANKELQLHEKERKAKIQYEKYLEEKHRKLREQKEKDERRRVLAEEKRKQKLEEDQERFKAVLSRTLERSNRMDQKQKRWSWEGSPAVTCESQIGLQISSGELRTENKRSSSLNRKESKMRLSNGHMEEKTDLNKKHIKCTPNPSRSHSSEELKTSTVHYKSAVKVPSQSKVEVASLAKREKTKASPEVSSVISREELPKVNLGTTPTMSDNVDMLTSVAMEATPGVSGMQTSSSLSTDTLTEVTMDMYSELSMDTSPLTSVEASPVVSLDTSPEASTDASPVASVDFSPEGSIEVSLEGMQVLPEASGNASCRAGTEGKSDASMQESCRESREALREVLIEATPRTNVEEPPKKLEIDTHITNPIIKKHQSGNIPRFKWPLSPTKERRPTSPITTAQNQKNCPPSPSPALKQSSPSPPSYKIIPVQRTVCVPNALDTLKEKRETVSKTTNDEAVKQKHMIHDGSGNKSTPGNMSAEEATKILAERRRLVREQKDKKEEENLQKEVEQRKMAAVSDKMDEAQVEEFSKCENRQQEKEIENSTGQKPQEDQEVMQQKGDAKINACEEADKRKKEQERIMLQNLRERLERKKRIEEIMKRTRKPEPDASKAMEASGNNITEEEEADDEDTKSEKGCLNTFSSGTGHNGDSSAKLKIPCKNATRIPQKVVLIQANTREKNKEQTPYFNGDVRASKQKDAKDAFNYAKGSSPLMKRMTTRTGKSIQARDATSSTPSTQGVATDQGAVCNQGFDFAHHSTESPATNSTPNSNSHNSRDSMATHQNSKISSDCQERSKPVPSQSDM